MDTFKYQKLDLESSAFRLVRLLKGLPHSDIRCDLIYTTLDENVIPYEAVSYTWGTSVKEYSIELNGARFMVTPNLWHLLGNVRKAGEDRYLWIDAIAINQDDALERGHQVQRMQRIYSGAEYVLFYLGEETPQISILMESLLLFQWQVLGRRWASDDERWRAAWETIQPRRGASDNEVTQRQGLEELLTRSWFRRAWVLQEVANARSALVICGTSSVRAQIFAMAPKFLGVNLDSHATAVFDLMPTHFGDKSRKIRDGSLLSILLNFRGSEASDPYDKIFALLGLCREEGAREWIIPDYTQDQADVIYATVCFLSGINGMRPVSTARKILTEAIPLLPSIEYASRCMLPSSVRPLMSQVALSLGIVAKLLSRPKYLIAKSTGLLFDITKSLLEIKNLSGSAFEGLFEKAAWLLSEGTNWLRTLRYLPPRRPTKLVLEIGALWKVNTPPEIGGFLSSLTDSQGGYMHCLILDILSTCKSEDLRSFLQRRENNIVITWETVEAALSNKFNAKDALDLLLRYGVVDIMNFGTRSGMLQRIYEYFANRLRFTLAALLREEFCSLPFFSTQDFWVRLALGIDSEEKPQEAHEANMWKVANMSTGIMELQEILELHGERFFHDGRGISEALSEDISRISLESYTHTAYIIRKWPALLMATAINAVIVIKRLPEMQLREYSVPCDIANLALNLALDSHDKVLLRRLLNNGVKLTLREYEVWEESYNPLRVLHDQKDLADLFRLYTKSLVTPPALGTTPLNFAANCGDKWLVKFALDQGADLEATDCRGRTAFDLAKERVKNEMRKRDTNDGSNSVELSRALDCYLYLYLVTDDHITRKLGHLNEDGTQTEEQVGQKRRREKCISTDDGVEWECETNLMEKFRQNPTSFWETTRRVLSTSILRETSTATPNITEMD
ncbi:hypothetical protein NPX13_g6260 [Xylaria arbuscula]|uniref:Heterokaryon incompatibility domain-containing protein n=1 Tax=Xylaria arbuscula TaxID=114810 RepID=A0A9W8NCU7_9PEZI|nr:hypothetical protein NPX13_g6260 [Xylaria arbuscula]